MSQHNFLLIGLGGTGCAVVRELKKKLYIEWRSRGNAGPYPEVYIFQDEFGGERVESRIATLSIDSNLKDLEGQGERAGKWCVFGETLRLGDREKELIDPSGMDRILNSVERFPGIEPWVRQDMEFVRDITRGSTEPAGCNQIRRMGRLALANGNSIKNVLTKVADRLNQLSQNGQVGAEIHIVCTLAAGTGSGSLMDVVAQVQRYLRNESGNFEVFVHGFATAKDVGDKNVGNFYANQYAALVELNALRLGLYAPWDIAAEQTPKRLKVASSEQAQQTGKLSGTYRSAALITETTEGGLNVSLDQQIDNVAEFIFQLAVRQMGDVPKPLRDALTLEDRKQFPADVNGGSRSTAFISYGVQRAAIPEREIREKLAYSFARQVLVKILYHNWSDRYRETPRNFARDAFIDTRRGLWGVTREHLNLDLVEDATGQKKFESYETDWRDILEKQAIRVREQIGSDYEARRQWLVDFDHRAAMVWKEGFRSQGDAGGVDNFFRIRKDANEIASRARHIRSVIESDLIRAIERTDADYPLHHLPAAIEFLVHRIEDDRKAFGEETGESLEKYEAADKNREEIRPQYEKCGRFSRGKQERLFRSYQDTTMRYYYWRTIHEAAQYATDFCLRLLKELKVLLQQITLFDTRLKQITTNIDIEINTRIPEEEEISSDSDVIYLVDAKAVNEAIRNRFENDSSLQNRQIDSTLNELKLLRGERLEFAAYTEKMPVDSADRVGGPFVDRLRQVSEINAIEAHRELCERDKEFHGLFGQNIVRKLYNDYGGQVDGKLEQWFRDLIDRSMPMIAFDPNEEPMDIAAGPSPVLRRCVFVPECKAHQDFSQHLRAKIESITGGRGSCKIAETSYQEVPEDRNPVEITIISVAFFFPARYTKVAHSLKEKFLERVQQKSDKETQRAFFELFTETHELSLPDLMKPGRKDVLKEQLSYVLLATALDFMQVPEETGQEILFGTVDEFGRVRDRVESGMNMDNRVLEAATESVTRFGQKIPVQTVALYSLYLDQFKEDSLPHLEKLIKTKLGEKGEEENLARIESALDTLSGQSFLLSGKKEQDVMYNLFRTKAAEAVRLARRFADKSSL